MAARPKLALPALLLALASCSTPPPATTVETDAGDTTDAFTPPVDGGRDVGIDGGDPPVTPEQICPGDPDCAPGGDMHLFAGAARIEITPDPTDYETFTDVNGNSEYDPANGDTFVDRNGNGVFDGVWMAGFGNARAATSVNDPQWVRTLVLRYGNTTIAWVAIDCVGYFIDEIDLIRAAIPASAGVDLVNVSATHVHEAQDTVGMWGRELLVSGYDDAYMQRIRDAAVQSVMDAVAGLEEANLSYGGVFLRDVDTVGDGSGVDDVLRYVGDNRDPFVMDDQIRLMRLVAVDGEGTTTGSDTIATLINYAGHPEYAGSRNTALSSDFPNWLRLAVEEGVDGPTVGGTLQHRDGVGGIAVFINGAVGVQIGPNHVHIRRWDGTPVDEDQLLASQTVGEQLGYHVLGALRGGEMTMLDGSLVPLGFRTARFYLPIQNHGYHLMFRNGVFHRDVFHYDDSRIIDTRRMVNVPDVYTEIAVIDVGPAQMFTIPGELDPILFTGIDGERAFTPPGVPVVDTTQENPPDITLPMDPPILALARADARDADQVWLLGLTNDFLGYMVPPFDFQTDSAMTYLTEAPGHHYEETNSIGRDGWPRIYYKLQQLLAYTP
ncbi:MAG: hypothetical protein U0234_03600 [Sandaracinus sp.]